MQGMNFKKQRERFEAKHPELVKKIKARKAHAYHIGRYHGMTRRDYDVLLRVQKGRCAICQRKHSEAGQPYLSVDHCHDTGRVRGLLCTGCNFRLGNVRENPERAARLTTSTRDALVAYIITRCVRSKLAGPL